jgi:hypothetical protein
VKNLFFEWLREHRPDLIPLYRRLYQRGAYMHPDERRRLGQLVKGPDSSPGERMRERLEARGTNGHQGADAGDVAGGWRGAGRPDDADRAPNPHAPIRSGASDRPGWLPEQGRLF